MTNQVEPLSIGERDAMLTKIVEWVEEQEALPEAEREWNQGEWLSGDAKWAAVRQRVAFVPTWDCGTKACACGRMALTLGAEIALGRAGGVKFDGLDPSDWGAAKLGIDWAAAWDLFRAENTAADIRRAAEEIAGHRL